MGDIEDMIGSVLGDPKQMEKIAGLARSLMGDAKPAAPDSADMGLDPKLLTRMSALMQSSGSGDDRRLLEAMRPFLSEKRRAKMDKALKLAKLASIAELAMTEFGGEDDV